MKILDQYDSDHLYPFYGFGAQLKDQKEISNCFPLNGNSNDPNIERVEEALETDRTRDGVASDTRLVEVAIDGAIDKRFGLATLTFEVEYYYTRGA